MSPKPPYYTQEELLAYLSGTLPQDKQDEIRMAAEKDPFLKEAIEGLSLDDYPAATLDALKRRISIKPEKSFPWIGVAAAVVILAIFIPLGYYFIQQSPQKTDSITMVTQEEEAKSLDTMPLESSEDLARPEEEPTSVKREKNIPESPEPVPAQPRDTERYTTLDETGVPDEDVLAVSELRTANAKRDEITHAGTAEEIAEDYPKAEKLDTDAVKPVASEEAAGYAVRKKELSQMKQYAVPGAETTIKSPPWKVNYFIVDQDTLINPGLIYKSWIQWLNELIDVAAFESIQLIITSETHQDEPSVKVQGSASKSTADSVIKWVREEFYLLLPELKEKSYTIDLEVYPQE